MSPWWWLLELVSWCPIVKSLHLIRRLRTRRWIDLISGCPIFKWVVKYDYMPGYQDDTDRYGRQVIFLITYPLERLAGAEPRRPSTATASTGTDFMAALISARLLIFDMAWAYCGAAFIALLLRHNCLDFTPVSKIIWVQIGWDEKRIGKGRRRCAVSLWFVSLWLHHLL